MYSELFVSTIANSVLSRTLIYQVLTAINSAINYRHIIHQIYSLVLGLVLKMSKDFQQTIMSLSIEMVLPFSFQWVLLDPYTF